MQGTWEKRRKRIFEIIEVGTEYDYVSRIYDFFNAFCIILNLAASMVYTFDSYREAYGALLMTIEQVTVALFMVDYFLGSGPQKSAHPRHCGRHPAGPPHPRPPWQHDPQDGGLHGARRGVLPQQ